MRNTMVEPSTIQFALTVGLIHLTKNFKH